MRSCFSRVSPYITYFARRLSNKNKSNTYTHDAVRQNSGLHATLSFDNMYTYTYVHTHVTYIHVCIYVCMYVRFNERKSTKPRSLCSVYRFTDNREFEILARFSSH